MSARRSELLPISKHETHPSIAALLQEIAERTGRVLEKRGLIKRDCENAWLKGDPEQAGSLDDLIGQSIT